MDEEEKLLEGEGGIYECPYCECSLEGDGKEEFNGDDLISYYVCPRCEREYEVRFSPDSWREI